MCLSSFYHELRRHPNFSLRKEKDAIHAALEQDWTPDSVKRHSRGSKFSLRPQPPRECYAIVFWDPLDSVATPLFNYGSHSCHCSLQYTFRLGLFAFTIIRSMSYSPIHTQLMFVPPYAATFGVSVAIALLADRWGQWGYSLFFSGILAMVGYTLFLHLDSHLCSLRLDLFTNHGRVHIRLGRWHTEHQ